MNITWNDRNTMIASIGLLIIIGAYITIKFFQGDFP